MAAAFAPLQWTTRTAARRAAKYRPVLRAVPAVRPLLSVVIVNYCQWRNTFRLTKCLRRSDAARGGDAEIVVVDNHSPDHELRRRLAYTRGVCLRRFRNNRGFAKAVNAACQIGTGDWVLLLNPDVSVPPGLLDRIDAFLRRQQAEDPAVGVIGLSVRNEDGTPQPSCGPLPTLARTVAGLFLPRSRRKCKPMQAEGQAEVAWATGCALLIRRDCLDQIGGFDEKFFLYYEDVDLCRRARERGWKVRFEPSLEVTHHTPLHGRQVPAALRMMTRHALLSFSLKYWPRWQSAVLGGMIGAESLVRQVAAALRGRNADAGFHAETRRIVADLLLGRTEEARARIDAAADHLAETAAAQDRPTC